MAVSTKFVFLTFLFLSVIRFASAVFEVEIDVPGEQQAHPDYADHVAKISKATEHANRQLKTLSHDIDHARTTGEIRPSISEGFGDKPDLDALHAGVQKLRNSKITINDIAADEHDNSKARTTGQNVRVNGKFLRMSPGMMGKTLVHEASHAHLGTKDYLARVESHPDGTHSYVPIGKSQIASQDGLDKYTVRGYHRYRDDWEHIREHASPSAHKLGEAWVIAAYAARWKTGKHNELEDQRKKSEKKHDPQDPGGMEKIKNEVRDKYPANSRPAIHIKPGTVPIRGNGGTGLGTGTAGASGSGTHATQHGAYEGTQGHDHNQPSSPSHPHSSDAAHLAQPGQELPPARPRPPRAQLPPVPPRPASPVAGSSVYRPNPRRHAHHESEYDPNFLNALSQLTVPANPHAHGHGTDSDSSHSSHSASSSRSTSPEPRPPPQRWNSLPLPGSGAHAHPDHHDHEQRGAEHGPTHSGSPSHSATPPTRPYPPPQRRHSLPIPATSGSSHSDHHDQGHHEVAHALPPHPSSASHPTPAGGSHPVQHEHGQHEPTHGSAHLGPSSHSASVPSRPYPPPQRRHTLPSPPTHADHHDHGHPHSAQSVQNGHHSNTAAHHTPPPPPAHPQAHAQASHGGHKRR